MPTVTTRIAQTFKKPNIAESYGTFASLQAAMTYAENADIKCAGLTVGILDQENGSVKEYWLQPVEGQLQFVEKQKNGQAGINAYVHIKYAAAMPASTQDMHDTLQTGDKWIGVYSGDSAIAPTIVNSYQWAKFVGEDGAAGKSAYQIARDNGFVGSEEQWLASLKATIGAFRFVDYDAVAGPEFTVGGIGTPYLGTVDSLEAGVDTNQSTILLMNNTDGTTPPTKTLMIATQEDSPATEQAPATYVFVYIGDLQDAMPSDILTADDLFEESDSDFDISDENGNIICQFNNGHIKTKYFNSEDTFNASEKAIIEKGDAGLSSKVTISDLPNVRNSYVISLYSEILSGDAFNGIKIAIDANSTQAFETITCIRGWIEIDNSNIRVLKYGATTTTETYSHGLPISDFIEVVVEPVAMHKAKFILYTNGGSYVIEDMPWYGCGGDLSVEPLSGTSLSGHYEFGITYYGFNNRLWIFGDSWCDFWPGAIEKLGIKNFLLDGYGGRRSQQAVGSFEKCLEFGKPTYLIWIMGMNDKDTLSGGTYVASTDYKYAFGAMKMACEELHIHFIPCTIVCGTNPARRNTGKNQYIKDSGLRYIPLAEELGGTTDSDTGYKGLINQLDMAHPTDPAGSMKVALCLAKYISNIIKTN